MAYIIITDNDTDVKDMIDNRKAAAYHPYSGSKIEDILHGESVLIYRTKKNSAKDSRPGIIAYGTAKEVFTDTVSNGKLNDCACLEPFIILSTPMPFSALKSIYSNFKKKKLVFVNRTTLRIRDDYAKAIITEIKLHYM